LTRNNFIQREPLSLSDSQRRCDYAGIFYIHIKNLEDVNEMVYWGKTVEYMAVWHNKKKCVQLAINVLADINIREEDFGWTALHAAAQYGHTECLQLLIKNGADIKIQNFFGETALDFARKSQSTECITLLENAAEQEEVAQLVLLDNGEPENWEDDNQPISQRLRPRDMSITYKGCC